MIPELHQAYLELDDAYARLDEIATICALYTSPQAALEEIQAITQCDLPSRNQLELELKGAAHLRVVK